MSFKSSIDDLVRYRSSRFPIPTYLALSVFLCTAGWAGLLPANPGDVVRVVLIAATLVFQFRLWDDLVDVVRDRSVHPDRVLPRISSRTHFWILLVGTFALNICWLILMRSTLQVLVFLILNAGFLAWYKYRGDAARGFFPGYHVPLLKYPCFVYLLSAGPANSNWIPLAYAMAITYLCFCIYEVQHDPTLRSRQGASRILAFEMTSLALVAALMVMDLGGLALRSVAAQGVLSAMGIAALAVLFRWHLTRVELGRWRYSVFVVGFLWLVNYSMQIGAVIGTDPVH